jgi:hypothetical protein
MSAVSPLVDDLGQGDLPGAFAQAVAALGAARAVEQAGPCQTLQDGFDPTPGHRQPVGDIAGAFQSLATGVPAYIQHDCDGSIGTFAAHKHGCPPSDRLGRVKFTSTEGNIG